jgi:hypothetical protein
VKPINLYPGESSEELRRKLITLMDDIYGRFNQVQDNVMDFNTNQVFQQPVSMAVESDEVDLDVTTHETDYDHSLLHGRSHAIDSSSDHTSTIVENNLMDADSNGLPDDSGISVTSVTNEINDVKALATKTSDYTLTASDCTIIVDATSGDVTIDTPAAPATGKVYTIKRIDSSGNTVTVDANSTGSTTIDDANTQTLNQYDALRIQYDATEWWII